MDGPHTAPNGPDGEPRFAAAERGGVPAALPDRGAPGTVADVRRAVAHVAAALAAAPSHDEALVHAARTAVAAYAVRLRDEGEPPQRMLVCVKDVARAAAGGVLARHEEDELVARVVRWSIDAYYAA